MGNAVCGLAGRRTMFLDIHDLERNAKEFAERYSPGQMDYGSGIRQVGMLDTEGAAELLGGEIHLIGSLSTTVETDCDRCLEPTRFPVAVDFDLYYRPVKSIAREEEIELKPSELEIGFYYGNGLQLEDALKEQVLLALPIKNICRPDCAGLCPQCGQNRNVAKCACQPVTLDARWEQLAKLKK